MEILSPVGAKEQLIAAVRNGANAVYLGTKNFNARRNADNFGKEELKEAVSFCHARNVKVYITLNTLVKDCELAKVAEQIKELAFIGIDAVIVQDLAVYRLVKEIAPELPIHASTQMTIHNLSGTNAVKALGFSRVVPARELSINELKHIKENCDIELEVFIHGALCMCMSGQCYLSSVLGQRSANRGLCAQPCRLDFKSKNGSHALSFKDLSAIDKIQELEKLGIDSAKIEGRMKRPEYVALSTLACKNALNDLPYDSESLKAVFSRSGFTDGYLTGKRNRDMFGYRTKEDVVSATAVLKSAANTYKNEYQSVAITMCITIKESIPILLVVSDGKNSIAVEGAIPEKAINKPTDEQLAKRSLEKCGGTPFYAKEIICNIDDGLCVLASSLNSLRKQALERLLEIRSEIKPHKINDYTLEIPKSERKFCENQLIYGIFEYEEQITDNVDKIIFDIDKLIVNPLLCQKYRKKIVAKLPTLMFNDNNLTCKLEKIKSLGINEVYAPNIYALNTAKKLGFKIIGGYTLNIINSLALKEYEKLGVDYAELSIENTLDSFNAIEKNIPCGIVAYGKVPLMIFRNCPIKSTDGCGICSCKGEILDRYNNPFTVMCHNREYSRLLNPQPIYMGDKKSQLKNADFITLIFTDETKSECERIIKLIKDGKEFKNPFTRGLYYKEIK